MLVYELVIGDCVVYPIEQWQRMQLAITRTSSLVRIESLPVYYATTRFVLDIDCVFCMYEKVGPRPNKQEYPANWMAAIGYSKLRHITRFTLCHTESCPDHLKLPSYRTDFNVSFSQGALGTKLAFEASVTGIYRNRIGGKMIDEDFISRLQWLLTIISEDVMEPGLSLISIKLIAVFLWQEAWDMGRLLPRD